MPFRSEKQRRYLWAKHPDIAKRWAKEYPESNKNLPMYKKDKPEEDKPVNKAAALKSLHSALVNNLSDFKNSSCLQAGGLNLKKADSKLTHIKMPQDDKPTYAGEKQTESILKPETEDEGSVGDLRRQEGPKNVTNPLLNKLAVVLAPKIQQELEDLKAQQEARNAQRVPENVNVKQYPVASATIPPPMGMTQAPQAPQQPAQPQQAPAQAQNGQLASVGGGSSPNANPINSFGGLSSTGDINGNAAFGTANGMGGEKLAKNSNNVELQKLLQQWEAQGGSQSAYPMSAHSKVPPAALPKELAAKLQQHLKYPKHIVPDEFDAAEALLALEEAQQPQKLAAQKCSCGCGQTVADCSCPVSCSCRQKGGSCYGKKTAAPKKASLDISQLLQDLNPVDSDELNPDELVETLTPVKPQEPNMAAIAAILGTSGTLEYLAGKTKNRPTMKQAAGDEMQAELMGMDHIEPDEIAELMERTKQAVDKWAGKQLGLWDRIRAKKQRGEKPAKPGDKDYPDSKSWSKVTAISEKKSADDKPEPKPSAAEKKKPASQPSLLTTGLIGAAGGLGGGLISQLLLSKLRKGNPAPEKQSAEVIQPFQKHKRQVSFPKQLQNSTISKADADAIAAAMSAAAPHGALDNTRVDLYGTKVKDLQERMTNNPRLSPLQRWQYRYDSIEGLPDKTQMLPDAYHPHADTVWLPSGNPGVMMHELGHSIDFNGYPNTTPRMLLAGLYARTAPTLWKEHAAWNKGQKYFLEGAAQNKLPPELVAKTLRDASRGKRMGLGSYWGAGLGTLAGGAGGAALFAANPNMDIRLPIGLAAIGGGLGGLTGLSLGNMAAESDKFDTPEATQKYLDRYAQAYSKKHKVPFETAQQEIQQLAEKLIAKKRKKKPAKKPQLAKAAGSPAWQRSEGKNEAGGLNEKGRKSYEREHGGNLKAPVTESNPSGERAKRQNSFCSRMCGMRRVNTGASTAKDPDSRINKSLRKWNCKCSSASEFGFKLAYDIAGRRQSTNVVDMTGNLQQPSRLTRLLGETPGTAVLPRNWGETKNMFKNEFDRRGKERDFFMAGMFGKPTPQASAVMNYADKLTDVPPAPAADRARSFATKYVPGAGRAMNQISPQAAPPTPANHPIANAVKGMAKKYPVTLPSVK